MTLSLSGDTNMIPYTHYPYYRNLKIPVKILHGIRIKR